MRFFRKGAEDTKVRGKEGWDLLLKDYELKRKNETNRAAQRHMSMGIGHHLARSFKGHF